MSLLALPCQAAWHSLLLRPYPGPGNGLTVAPMCALQGSAGLRLPFPRESLGVQIAGNSFFVLLPYSVCTPCSARQIFSTVHDNQSEVRGRTACYSLPAPCKGCKKP